MVRDTHKFLSYMAVMLAIVAGITVFSSIMVWALLGDLPKTEHILLLDSIMVVMGTAILVYLYLTDWTYPDDNDDD